MKKSNKKQENVQPEIDPVEQHVREIMEPDPKPDAGSQPAAKSPEQTSTAPELPGKSIKVNFADNHPEEEQTDSVNSAIEEVNQQLQDTAPIKENTVEEPQETATEDTETEPAEADVEQPEVSEETPETEPPASAEDEVLPDIDDPETDAAVEDIIVHESDDLIAAEDEKLAAAFTGPAAKPDSGIKRFFAGLRHNAVVRKLFAVLLVAGAIAAFAVPVSRYSVLNAMGVRSSASMTIIDQSTQQPLRNVDVRLGGQIGKTDDTGSVTLEQLRLGPSELIIERRAFSAHKKQVTVGWGSNPLGEYALRPSGTQYAFRVTDYVSGQPISKAEAVYEDVSAFSDEEGLIRLTLDGIEDDSFEVSIIKDEYREEDISIDSASKAETAVEMVSARKHVFISKRSGKYDVYKIDADGNNEELILEGTGNEREDMVLIPHPAEELVALVSTRDGERNKDGFLLSTLNIIDLRDNTVIEVAQSERIQIVGWSESQLAYVRIAAGASASDPNRHRLTSYDYESDEKKELAAANYFNDVTAVGNKVYYAPSSAYMSDRSSSLYVVDADGNNQRKLLDKEAWSLLRNGHDSMIIALQQEWYEYRPGSEEEPEKLEGEPASMSSRVYTDSPDGSISLWVDRRDGKGVLVAYDTETKEDTVIHTQSGLKNPVRWLNDHTLLFRIKSDTETADYVMSLHGGEPKKVRDVTDTNGIDRWYYY